ncbi:MAG: hypothetical protein GX146_01690 [Myxococcales bacterium]|jgi:hypothetical protein|nr:hypothetical protein [Myxococcales bacterium]
MNPKRLISILSLSLCLGTAASTSASPHFEPLSALANTLPAHALTAPSPRINGITIAPIEDSQLGFVGYGSPRCKMAIDELPHLGANWVSLTPFGRMENLEDTFIIHDFEIPVAQNEQYIRDTARWAQQRGLRVALIPHLYVMSGQWRGDIDFPKAAQWATWFAAYKQYLLRWAAVARDISADLFSIGVEFKSSSNYHEETWRQLIAEVRRVYPGPLTYSANWDEVEQVPFWDALDHIGINAFWPLARKPGDGYAIIRAITEMLADELEALSVFYGKPILFTEMGIKSATDAALAPWEWPEHLSGMRYDEAYQAMAYDAFFDAMRPRSWFSGLFIWKYFADPFDETQEALTGFTPRAKAAEAVLSRHFWAPPHTTFAPIF